MNIAAIELENFGSWESVSLRLDAGLALIAGPNGSGKSTLLAAIEFAMFGVSSGADRLVRRGTDRALVRATIDTERGRVIAERSIRLTGNRAAISLALSAVDPETGAEDPITAATVGESQAILEGYLGVSRELLRVSCFAMQGQGGVFCEAPPSERKQRLSEALSLGQYAAWHEGAKDRARVATMTVQAERGTLESLGDAAAALAEAEQRVNAAGAALTATEAANEAAVADAEALQAEAAAAREAQQARDQRRAAFDHARAEHARAEADVAAARAEHERACRAVQNSPNLTAAEAVAAQARAEVEEAQRVYDAERADLERMTQEHSAAVRAREAAEGAYARAVEQAEDLEARHARAASGTCSECGQPLHTPEARELASRLAAAAHEAACVATEAAATLQAARNHVALYEGMTRVDIEEAYGQPLRDARVRASSADAALGEARAAQALADSAAAAAERLGAATARAQATEVALADASDACAFDEPDEDDALPARLTAALTQLEQARAALTSARIEHARANDAHTAALADAEREQQARERLAAAEHEAAIETLLAAGFGPAGAPAMIVDSALGQLAETWNRVLADVGARQRIDLRTQRVLKTSDRLADTLDIVVLDSPFDAPYETLSGGERTRVQVAGRIALTEMLAAKKGARVRMLVLDEPAGLDHEGCEQLATVLQEFVAAGLLDTVLLVTHQSELADLVGSVVRIAKGADGTSRVLETPSGGGAPPPPPPPRGGAAPRGDPDLEAVDA